MVKSESFAQSLSVKTQSQKTSSSSSIVSTATQFSLGKEEVDCGGVVSPPPLPQKKKNKDRQPSPYDNVPEGNMGEFCPKLLKYHH